MSQNSIAEYLQVQRERYLRRPRRQARGALLDECVKVSGLERKHLIKVLGGRRPVRGDAREAPSKRPGRPPAYEAIRRVIKAIWLAAEQPCGKRLHTVLRLAAALGKSKRPPERRPSRAPAARQPRAARPPPAPCRAAGEGAGRRRRGGDGILKAQVPLRTGPWDISGPGRTEVDSVAHCGGSMSDGFWWTTVLTDVCTGWTQQYPAWNKGQHNTREALKAMENQLPFALLGIDTDKGSEFLNWHLLTWIRDRAPAIDFTRSRPYHKNDNAHIEQKNRTHVRELLGEDRLDDPSLAPLLIELHTVWSDLHNFFLPTLKLIKKERVGSKIRKTYEPRARTPYGRLLEDKHLQGPARIALQVRRSEMNPFVLKTRAEQLLTEIWRQQNASAASQTGDATIGENALPSEAPAQAGGDGVNLLPDQKSTRPPVS